jgi:RNA polymerase II subunit A small phosphatase-like protein
VWTCSQCTLSFNQEYHEHFWRKNLDKVKRHLKRPLEQILMIDDNPEKLDRHYGNLIMVLPYKGNVVDTELRDILPFLHWMCTIPNVRLIEKRYWRTFQEK